MLLNIPHIISAELLKIMCEMGHGDELVIVDANYPAASSKASHIVDAKGISSNDLLKAILDIFPVDTYIEKPFKIMKVVDGDNTVPVVWRDYYETLKSHGYSIDQIEYIERYEYYKQCNKMYCVISSGEQKLYGNIAIRKGVIPD